jgi:hypothetical protein
MLDQPFRLDFKRNRILTWDEPGPVSPPPYLPFGEGPEALARYLLGHGVRYVAYCDGPPPAYIGTAQAQALNSLSQGIRYVAYCDRGPLPGDPEDRNAIIDDLAKLAPTRKQLYADKGIHVLDLATPAPPPP